MPSITLKNIPDKLFARIKESARRNHHSVNSEILLCLESSMSPRKIDPEAPISRIEALNQELNLPLLTEQYLQLTREAEEGE